MKSSLIILLGMLLSCHGTAQASCDDLVGGGNGSYRRNGEKREERFKKKLLEAIKDIRHFEADYGISINVGDSFDRITPSFETLRNEKQVLEFKDRFLASDRLTRQYMLNQVTEFRVTPANGAILTLKGGDLTHVGLFWRLDMLLGRSQKEIQQEAHFSYRSRATARRPKLSRGRATIDLALAFVERMKYNLANDSVYFASRILAHYRVADEKIDEALGHLHMSFEGLPEGTQKYHLVAYHVLEMGILERRILGLSAQETEFEYTAKALSTELDTLHLAELVKFHLRYNIRRFPKLRRLVKGYIQRFETSLRVLANAADNHPAGEILGVSYRDVDKFWRELR